MKLMYKLEIIKEKRQIRYSQHETTNPERIEEDRYMPRLLT